MKLHILRDEWVASLPHSAFLVVILQCKRYMIAVLRDILRLGEELRETLLSGTLQGLMVVQFGRDCWLVELL